MREGHIEKFKSILEEQKAEYRKNCHKCSGKGYIRRWADRRIAQSGEWRPNKPTREQILRRQRLSCKIELAVPCLRCSDRSEIDEWKGKNFMYTELLKEQEK